MTTSFVFRLGVLIIDMLQTRPNMFNVSFILKTLPLNSRSASLTANLYLVSTQVKYLSQVSHFPSDMTWSTQPEHDDRVCSNVTDMAFEYHTI